MGVGAFVIGLSQVSSFFCKTSLNMYYFKHFSQEHVPIWSPMYKFSSIEGVTAYGHAPDCHVIFG